MGNGLGVFALHRDDAKPVFLQDGDFSVVHIHCIPDASHEGGGVAGQEGFVITQPDHERRSAACSQHQSGQVGAEHRYAVRSTATGKRFPEGLEQTILFTLQFRIMMGDQVAEHLGIGFRGKLDPFAHEEALEVGEILDHTVVHEGDLAVLAEVRVGVGHSHGAVRGPAGMGDAQGALRVGFS